MHYSHLHYSHFTHPLRDYSPSSLVLWVLWFFGSNCHNRSLEWSYATRNAAVLFRTALSNLTALSEFAAHRHTAPPAALATI